MRNIIFVLMIMIFASCEKEIDINLNVADPKIVIEGEVKNGSGPHTVKISKTVNFSESNNYPSVSGALVVISDNHGRSDTLKESIPGVYHTKNITGVPGNTYSLSVYAEGKDYYAVSTMPYLVKMDSLRFSMFSSPIGGSGDTYITIPVFTDPVFFSNNYRFIQAVNGKEDKSYVVFNDNVSNGSVNQRPIFNPESEMKVGDTVTVEMRCIDNTTYTYFYSLSQTSGGGPGGGTTPSNPPNNITGNFALGLFTAYTTQKITQVIK